MKANETVVLVGGGIGVPPMYEMAKRLHEKGHSVIAVLGFASACDVFYEEELKLMQMYISQQWMEAMVSKGMLWN